MPKPFSKILIASSIALTLCAAHATAREKPAAATIKLFDTVLQFPLPNWQNGADAAKESEIDRRQNDKAFILQFIPKGEKFSSWNRLYAVRADKGADLSFEREQKGQLGLYVKVCGKDNLRQQVLSNSKTHVMFVLICADSPKGPPKFGYGPGIGEVAVFWISKNKNTLVKVYQHWRGKAFDPDKSATWPVKQETVQQVIDAFGKIKLQ